ncbi:MAG: ABC transporter permease [Candidatus Cloacimonadales bacterium]|nr:ABC transporter permease [Candidatus Cloacimonadota bacterium]MDX9977913.1 ABC transporter permease [Candidatus Cloacimonadales bacterium]
MINRPKKSCLLNLTTFTFVIVFLYIPILLLIIYSFNDSKFISSWRGFTFKYYHLLFQNKDIINSFKNTMLIAVLSTIFSTILGLFSALALENKKFKGAKFFQGLIFIPLIMPDILMGVSLALLFSFVKVKMGMLTVLFAHITFCVSYTIIVIQSRLEGFDYNLIDAAMDLGANKRQIFFKIQLPLLMPGIIAAALLAFTLSIDDFMITFFTSGRGFNTLPVYVEGAIRRGTITTINALSTLMIGLALFFVVISKRVRKYIINI